MISALYSNCPRSNPGPQGGDITLPARAPTLKYVEEGVTRALKPPLKKAPQFQRRLLSASATGETAFAEEVVAIWLLLDCAASGSATPIRRTEPDNRRLHKGGIRLISARKSRGLCKTAQVTEKRPPVEKPAACGEYDSG